ncbi:hypothetical protein ACHAQD_006994 [Fusarium lateritium]
MAGNSSTKRSNKGSAKSGNAPKVGRPPKVESSQDPDTASRRYARKLLQRRPPVPWSNIRQHLELTTGAITDTWTQEDEDAILEIWNECPAKGRNMNTSQFASMLTLHKYSVRVLKASPNWVISPFFGLRYQPVGNNSGAGNGDILSKRICEDLASLIVHPCFEAECTRLAWALQYAITCRLDDRQCRSPTSKGLKNSCPALKYLYGEMRAGVDILPEPLHSMHTSARTHALENGNTPSHWSDLLHHIGEKVLTSRRSNPSVTSELMTHLGFQVLPLTLWDVIIITEAVDTMEFSKPLLRYSVAEARKSFKAELKGNECPSRHQLSELFEITFKDMLRCSRSMAKQSNSDASSEAEDSDKGDEPQSHIQAYGPEQSESDSGFESDSNESEFDPESDNYPRGNTQDPDMDSDVEMGDNSPVVTGDVFQHPTSTSGSALVASRTTGVGYQTPSEPLSETLDALLRNQNLILDRMQEQTSLMQDMRAEMQDMSVEMQDMSVEMQDMSAEIQILRGRNSAPQLHVELGDGSGDSDLDPQSEVPSVDDPRGPSPTLSTDFPPWE